MKQKPTNKANSQDHNGKQPQKDTLALNTFTYLLALYEAKVYERYYPLG